MNDVRLYNRRFESRITIHELPSAVILKGSASFTSFTGGPVTTSTSTVPSVSPEVTDVTTAVPTVVVDLSIIVAWPADAGFTVVPSRVPTPDTLNVIVLVALITTLSPLSHILEVTSDVEEPSAAIDSESAVFKSFVG